MSADPGAGRRDRGKGWAPALLLLALIVVPMAWTVGYSLVYSLGGIGLFSEGWTLDHWWSAIGSGGLRASLLLTPAVAGTATLLATSGALLMMLAGSEPPRGKLVPALLLVPLATPSVVTAVIVYQLLNPGGLFARLAYRADLIGSPSDFPVLVMDPYAVGMILAQATGAAPLLALFFLRTWETVRAGRYCLLAQALGATSFQARWQVGAPMLLRRGRPLILLVFLWNLGSYEIPLLLGRQAPQMFSVLIQRRSGQFNLSQRPEAFALAATYFLLLAVGVTCLLAWRKRHG